MGLAGLVRGSSASNCIKAGLDALGARPEKLGGDLLGLRAFAACCLLLLFAPHELAGLCRLTCVIGHEYAHLITSQPFDHLS